MVCRMGSVCLDQFSGAMAYLAGVGGRDFVDFIGVKPDLALPTARHRGRQPLLDT